MNKLISMTDFVLEQYDNYDFSKVYLYANFLKQPLKLEMFVPCDDKGNVLTEIDGSDFEYHQAKTKVLFEGFECINTTICFVKNGNCIYPFKKGNESKYIIEHLIKDNLTLTQSALKQIGI